VAAGSPQAEGRALREGLPPLARPDDVMLRQRMRR
jgi:hypothetical protein